MASIAKLTFHVESEFCYYCCSKVTSKELIQRSKLLCWKPSALCPCGTLSMWRRKRKHSQRFAGFVYGFCSGCNVLLNRVIIALQESLSQRRNEQIAPFFACFCR